jgi:hypothetical protein
VDKEYINKALATVVAGYVIVTQIENYGDEPHLHPEIYQNNLQNRLTISVVVSGTNQVSELPEFIQDFGENPNREGENLYLVNFMPTSLDNWDK